MVFDYKEWYDENRNTLSNKRKRRYWSDKKHREAIKGKARSYYNMNKKKTVSGYDNTTINQNGTMYYTIGKVSKLIHKAECTIRKYHIMGVIPKITRFDSRGWRLYSKKQTDLIVKVFREFKRKKLRTLQDVKKKLIKNWGNTE